MQRCCLSSPYSNKSLTLAKYHQTDKASGTEGSVYKLPVVDYTNTLRTNKAFKKIYFHTGAMNDTKYANILT